MKSTSKSDNAGSAPASGPNSQSTSSPTPSPPTTGGASPSLGSGQEPTWVNGSFLTCGWTDSSSTTDVNVLCQWHKNDALLMTAADISANGGSWQISTIDASGNPGDVTDTKPGAPEQSFTMAATDFSSLFVSVLYTIPAGATDVGYVGAPFNGLLPGTVDDTTLVDCLNAASASPQSCIDASKVALASPGTVEPPASNSRTIRRWGHRPRAHSLNDSH
ncbi:MAG: hypothetical protein NTZ90_06275 [Proteobacteria bacterium]|nr:hypothetical protein [Pseudomonadota bacterium]